MKWPFNPPTPNYISFLFISHWTFCTVFNHSVKVVLHTGRIIPMEWQFTAPQFRYSSVSVLTTTWVLCGFKQEVHPTMKYDLNCIVLSVIQTGVSEVFNLHMHCINRVVIILRRTILKMTISSFSLNSRGSKMFKLTDLLKLGRLPNFNGQKYPVF